MSTSSVPLLGDISLQFVQRMEHSLDAGFTGARIPGLEGELQQRAGRLSHRMCIEGVLFGDSAAGDLGTLQKAVQTGDELTFAADITSALDLQKVVIRTFHAEESAGRANQVRYRLDLVESPPLPPPAELSGFGGLDDFGLGDLGIDLSVLGDIEGLAGDIAAAADQALGAIATLESLASLAASGGLDFGGILDPLNDTVNNVRTLGASFQDAARALAGMFSK
jgi:hypothetical protein